MVDDLIFYEFGQAHRLLEIIRVLMPHSAPDFRDKSLDEFSFYALVPFLLRDPRFGASWWWRARSRALLDGCHCCGH